MKILVPMAFVSILLVSACTGPQEDKNATQTAQTPAAAPTAPEAAPTTPEEAPTAPTVHNYQCESGQTIIASYPTTDSATVQYKGTSYTMQIAVSGSGSRYVGGDLEWWTKGSGAGSEGSLSHHLADGTTGDGIEFCTES